MTAEPTWLKDPAAANDPTAAEGWQVQEDRPDLREGNALVQTPDFIADFLLDRTLDPAIETFGLHRATVIDPACGTGHLVCAAYMRLAAAWWSHKPVDETLTEPERMGLAQLVLDQVAGIELDPGCADLARRRLGTLASQFAGIPDGAYPWQVHVASADALLHGPDDKGNNPEPGHSCGDRDCAQALAIMACRYAAVVANPPYIQGSRLGPEKNAAYRKRYPSVCYKAYSLSVPFMVLTFELAIRGEGVAVVPEGHLFDPETVG